MSNGSQRRNRRRQSAKRYRIRFDRIAAAALVLIVLIVILTSCVKSCSKDDKKSDSSDTASATATGTTAAQSSIVDNLDTSKQTDSLVITSIDDMKPTASEFVVESHSRDDVYMGNLVLVNADNEYKFKEGDTDALTLYNNRSNEYYNVCDYVVKLDKETLASLDNWMKGFYEAKKNTDLTVIGGYRTLEEQNDKYNARTFDLGIFPKDGSSSGYYSPRGDYAWLDENAAEYGFIVRFPEGKEELTGEHPRTQTYRYVGKPHSVYIKQNGLCLEEYIEKIKSYTNTEPLEITVGQSFYQVYYVSASAEGNTDVPVPQNNKDGFIVTVSLN